MSVDTAASNHAGHHRPGDGYWIAATGHVLRVTSRHIVEVCQRPEAFGFCAKDLEAIFEAHEEAWASEQNAREDIIRALVSQGGWTRVRHYHRRQPYWSFNLPNLSVDCIALAGGFLRSLGMHMDSDERVVLDAKAGRRWSTVGSLVQLEAPFEQAIIHVPNAASLPMVTDSLPSLNIVAVKAHQARVSNSKSDSNGDRPHDDKTAN